MYLHLGYICVSLLQYSSLYCPQRCLSCSSLCFTWTYLFNSSLCWARRWPTAACGAPRLSVYKSQCCTKTCLSTRTFVCTGGVCQIYRASAALMRVCLQELLCAPEVSIDYIELVLHYSCPSIRALCCTWKCLSSRACAAFVHVLADLAEEFWLDLALASVTVTRRKPNLFIFYIILP